VLRDGIERRALLKGLAALPVAATLLPGDCAWTGQPATLDPRERRLRNLRQLTFGGQNAEAYFSPDGKRLIFQSTRDGRQCDQIYTMDLDGDNMRMVSTGKSRPARSSSPTGGGSSTPPRTWPVPSARPVPT
jgi:hypothetical protein